jgi:DNA-directed RNA polymerase subunit RPC12/RpoP
MALVTCPDCGREISGAAPTCISCGRPMQVSQAQPPVAPPQETPAGWKCSRCGGTEFKKHSLLYEEQRHTTSSIMKGLGWTTCTPSRRKRTRTSSRANCSGAERTDGRSRPRPGTIGVPRTSTG